jgi:hypothetical protein
MTLRSHILVFALIIQYLSLTRTEISRTALAVSQSDSEYGSDFGILGRFL